MSEALAEIGDQIPGLARSLEQVVDDILAAPHLRPAEMRIALAEARGRTAPTGYRQFVRWATSIGISRSQAYEAGRRRSLSMGWGYVPPADDDEDVDWDDSAEIQPGPTALYRWYDAVDLLLYVGISDRLRDRTGSHVKWSSWMDFAARSTIERFPSRDEAIGAEEKAIGAECPLFNKQLNDTPEARRRLVEYLVKHDRLDLLSPAVSRG